MSPRTATTAGLGTILSVWAHPDDETYLAGGAMAAAADRGCHVVCVSATAGERGTPDPATWPPSRLGPIRAWETAAAMAVLGVADHRILGLPDGSLAEHDEQGLDHVGRLLDEVQPDTILTFGPDGFTFHPDHIAVHHWVTQAWHERGRRSRLLYATSSVEQLARFGGVYEEVGVYMTDERPPGVPTEQLDVNVVLSGPELDRKVSALAAMASQTREMLTQLGSTTYASMVANETFIDATRLGRRPSMRLAAISG